MRYEKKKKKGSDIMLILNALFIDAIDIVSSK